MLSFGEIRAGARIAGIDGPSVADVIDVTPFGPDALNIVYRVHGRVAEKLIYRGDEAGLTLAVAGRAFSFDADGHQLRLASEAQRIRLAHLFDPYLAVTSSQIEALPHQITAVYGEMLPRQPLSLPARRRPGCRQDDHGGAPHQGTHDPGRPRPAAWSWHPEASSSNGRRSWSTSSACASTCSRATRSRRR